MQLIYIKIKLDGSYVAGKLALTHFSLMSHFYTP